MDHREFFDRLADGNLPNVLLMQGEEEYIKESAIAHLRAATLPEGLELMNEAVFEGAAEESAIIEACETLPFMAEKRLVFAREHPLIVGGAGGGDGARLVGYLSDVPETTTLVFSVRGGADMRRKLPAAIAKRGGAVAFRTLDERDTLTFLRREAKKLGKALDPAAAQRLLFLCGRDLTVLSGELEKAAAYAGDGETVGPREVEAVAVPCLEANVYEMVDAVLDGRNARAEALCRSLVRDGESPIAILAALTRNLRQLRHARAMLDAKRPRPEIERAVGVSGYIAGKVLRRAQSLDAGWLGRAQGRCEGADYEIKSGRVAAETALDSALTYLMLQSRK